MNRTIKQMMKKVHPSFFKRYKDRCYAVVVGNMRGPCGHDKPTALARFIHSGLIKSATSDKHTTSKTNYLTERAGF